VANPLPLVGLGKYDVWWDAGLTMSNEDDEYPVGNSQGVDPIPVAKSTTPTTTITATFPSATLAMLAIFQTNAETGTINGHAITFPGLDDEGQRIHPFLDLRALGITTGSVTIVLSRASGVVWFGRISLMTRVEALNVKYGFDVEGRERPGDEEIPTRRGSIIYGSAELRTRWAQGVVDLIEDEAMLSTLDLSARGKRFPMLFIPDENVNSAWWARQTNPYVRSVTNYDVRPTKLRFDELSCGPVNL
jgi:hypothetical protein